VNYQQINNLQEEFSLVFGGVGFNLCMYRQSQQLSSAYNHWTGLLDSPNSVS